MIKNLIPILKKTQSSITRRRLKILKLDKLEIEFLKKYSDMYFYLLEKREIYFIDEKRIVLKIIGDQFFDDEEFYIIKKIRLDLEKEYKEEKEFFQKNIMFMDKNDSFYI